MPKLIKDRELIDDTWQRADSADTIDNQHQWILPLAEFLVVQNNAATALDFTRIGVAVTSDDNVKQLQPAIADGLQLIVIEFPVFTDGRGFSLARIIREQLDYKNELRAAGYFLPEQLYYLNRCGFDSYVVEDDADVDSLLENFNDFSETYQAAYDEPQPLFRRRV